MYVVPRAQPVRIFAIIINIWLNFIYYHTIYVRFRMYSSEALSWKGIGQAGGEADGVTVGAEADGVTAVTVDPVAR